jgi:hypothetical protein
MEKTAIRAPNKSFPRLTLTKYSVLFAAIMVFDK